MTLDLREILHFHLFGGGGGGAKGFNRGQARVGNMVARFRCVGSVDVDAAACRDFDNHIGVRSTCRDLFDHSQYIDWHGHEPPRDWREATPADIRRAAGGERPHIVFLSAPCKGFSGLQSASRSASAKYQALNRLTLRGIWLMLEAWADDPPELVLFENVPRIATRGRHLLDQIGALLRRYGYAVNETTHDCGEIGGLAQSRKRFLLVARHLAKVPPFLYQPRVRPLKAVGTVLDRCPLPGDIERAGPMHRVPSLQWKTWVRLAFVEAGQDWRSLQGLRVADGMLADYGIAPEVGYRNGVYGVQAWDCPSGVVAGESLPSNGRFAVADPRFNSHGNDYGQYGVRHWSDTMGTVIGVKSPGQGGFSVADPRCPQTKHNNCFRVVPFDAAAGTVTTGGHPSAGGQAVADPRPQWNRQSSHYRVVRYDEWSPTVTGGGKGVQGGALSVADPRPRIDRSAGQYVTGGHYGVVPYDAPSYAVTSSAKHDNGHWSVADPRYPASPSCPKCGGPTEMDHNSYQCHRCRMLWPIGAALPAPGDKVTAVIRALDGTWHRPFTTFELACLQSYVEPEEQLVLDGMSDQAWRERIGNMVPPDAAEAMAGVMGRTLLLAWSGETFTLDNAPIWVRPIATAVALPGARP